MAKRRPKCNARLLSRDDPSYTLDVSYPGQSSRWIAAGCADAHFGRHAWLESMRQLIRHPERTSSSILRADIIDESFDELTNVQRIRRRLLPRRPKLDGTLEQDCWIHAQEGVVILTPDVQSSSELPFYHPNVQSLAFVLKDAKIEAYIVPFDADKHFDFVTQPQHRLSRTVIGLLDVQAKIAWGAENGYRKRVEHDVIVRKTDYQALYMNLREKYAASLIKSWAESTDPLKHVFEDLGIVAFLILLWRQMFPDTGKPESFVDVGCGNGLLVFLLHSEGYSGFGVDGQERKSWTRHRLVTPTIDLRAEPVNAPSLCLADDSAFPAGSFLIGNHADELTAWLPLLAHRTKDCPGFVNIPCCRFALDGTTFDQTKYRDLDDDELQRLVDPHLYATTKEQVERGPLAEKDSTSRNIAYLRFLTHLHLQAGWQIEKEALRIPSTKNWAFIGRHTLHATSERKSDVNERVCLLASRSAQRWTARSFCHSNATVHH